MEKFYYTKVFKREKYIHLRTLDVDSTHQHCQSRSQTTSVINQKQRASTLFIFSQFAAFVQTELRVMMEHVWFITVTHNSIGQHWYITCHPLPQTSK